MFYSDLLFLKRTVLYIIYIFNIRLLHSYEIPLASTEYANITTDFPLLIILKRILNMYKYNGKSKYNY